MTTNQAVRAEVYGIVSDVFLIPAADIDPARPWDEMGAGSFDLVEFIVALRDRFALDLDPSQLATLRTIDDVVDYVTERDDRNST